MSALQGAQLFKGWASHVAMDQLPGRDYGVTGRSAPSKVRSRVLEHDLTDEANALLHTEFTHEEAMWNVYTGTCGLPFHHDHLWPYIAIVSFGQEADFMLDPCEYDNAHEPMHFTVGHGDLLYLPEDVNRGYAHGVKHYDNDRWSLVLRPEGFPLYSGDISGTCANHKRQNRAYLDAGLFSLEGEDRALPHECF